MIRKYIGFCLLLIFGCSDDEKVPSGILSEDEMTGILMEVYIKEAQVTSYSPRLHRDSSEVLLHVLKEDILEEYNTDDSTFRESMRWYFQRPEQLEKIYARLIDSLTLKSQQIKETETAE